MYFPAIQPKRSSHKIDGEVTGSYEVARVLSSFCGKTC
jgi:hypothetical protein